MKLFVGKHKIVIDKDELVNEKEINVSKCIFEFDTEIPEEYSKKAFFTFNGKTYEQIIVNNECSFPYEALESKGQVEIGVIAYEIANNEYVARFNPSPAYFNTWQGSLKEEIENSSNPTPSELEQIESEIAGIQSEQLEQNNAISTNSTNIDNLELNKQPLLVSGNNIKTINNESILGSGNIEIKGESGSSNYQDLTNKPSINSVELNGNKTSRDLGLQPAGNYLTEVPSEYKTKAENDNLYQEKGNYLTEENDPTVPSYVKRISQNDITNWNNKANTSDIPDVSGFITKTVNDLTNYYLKSEVNNLIGAIQQFHYEVVQELPQTGANNILYLVPKTTTQTNNTYDEYVYANNNWEKIGDTEIDLSNYVTTTQLNTTLANYTTTTVLNSLLNNKQDTLTAGENITIENNVISATGGGSSELINGYPVYHLHLNGAWPVSQPGVSRSIPAVDTAKCIDFMNYARTQAENGYDKVWLYVYYEMNYTGTYSQSGVIKNQPAIRLINTSTYANITQTGYVQLALDWVYTQYDTSSPIHHYEYLISFIGYVRATYNSTNDEWALYSSSGGYYIAEVNDGMLNRTKGGTISGTTSYTGSISANSHIVNKKYVDDNTPKITTLTQQEYDAIQTKDANTYYFIIQE